MQAANQPETVFDLAQAGCERVTGPPSLPKLGSVLNHIDTPSVIYMQLAPVSHPKAIYDKVLEIIYFILGAELNLCL